MRNDTEPRYDSVTGQGHLQEEFRAPFIGYRKGKGQLINEKGVAVSEPESGRWRNLNEGRMALQSEKGVRLYGYDGKEIGDVFFEEVQPFSEGNAPARISGKWGFLNLFGKMVIAAQYEAVLPYKGGIAYAKQNGKWGVLKKNGSWLVKPVGIAVAEEASGKRKLVMP